MRFFQWLRRQVFLPQPQAEPKVTIRKTDFRRLRISHTQVVLYPETVERLNQLRGQAIALQERVEAMADEACELMGFDPTSEDCISEIAKDVVFGCESVDVTIDHLVDVMRLRESARRGSLQREGGEDE